MKRHNATQHPLYNTWRKIKEKHYDKHEYVCMCVPWMMSFNQFIKDVGDKPGPDYYLKRIYMDKSYGPKNFRWVQRNKKVNKLISKKSVSQGHTRVKQITMKGHKGNTYDVNDNTLDII